MSAIYILIPASLLLAAGFFFAFMWAVRSGQYEDTYTPSMRVLTEDGSEKRQSLSKEQPKAQHE